tara:strand:+ start:237 stop:896 length:660 start_codon:yes stop_codon:yes gene_type:complete
MKVNNSSTGIQIVHEKFIVHFGNQNFHKNDIPKMPFVHDYASVHQVHGDVCVEAKPGQEPKADALYSYEKNRAILLKTADCVPLFFYCSITDTIAAVHAGWRGLYSEIIKKSVEKSFPYSNISKLQVFIGPHISTDNYEFGKEDIDKLSSVSPSDYYVIDKGKYFLDLNSIYLHQLLSLGFIKANIHIFNKDTYSDPNLYSYRRNQTKDRLFHLILRRA